MPQAELKLVPGVNVERTPTLLEAGYSQTQFGRFKDSLFQKLGGWMKFFQFAVAGTPRDLHAWQDLNGADHLSVGTTTQLGIITSGNYQDITPQQLTTNPAPNFTTSANSPTVTVVDPNITNVTTYDAVLFNTPVAVDGIILSGLYPIVENVGANSYDITATNNAVSGVTAQGVVPVFTTSSGSALVAVALNAHGLSVGSTVVFPIATTGDGVTIKGSYIVVAVGDVNDFTITVTNQASAGGSFGMNGGNVQFVYYINLGPAAVGSGYGLGGYGLGGYGTGTTSSSQTGTEITATDWTTDNFGEILLACPQNGGVYQFDPTGGFNNAGLVSSAPPFNGGIFVSVSEEILLCWASTANHALDALPGLGISQDPLLIKWSNVGDFTNFVPLTTDQAGDYRIGIGSKIVAGGAVQNQNLFWTDLDLWAANYQGQPFVFGFNRIGVGAGAVSSHAIQSLRGNVYWMGPSNFYAYDTNGVHVITCPVWDFVFQNLNTGSDANGRPYINNVRAMPNTPFNECGWVFPSQASLNGENDCYVKMNIVEPGAPWDVGPAGTMPRSAWIDQTVLGPPIGATPTGVIYQHETSPDADGQPLAYSFTTGYFYIAEGEDYVFVDRVIPDFKWGTYGGAQTAQVQMSFNVVNFPGDTPTAYGPYLVTATTPYITTRFRGALTSITVSGDDIGSFVRLGKVRFRYAIVGRR